MCKNIIKNNWKSTKVERLQNPFQIFWHSWQTFYVSDRFLRSFIIITCLFFTFMSAKILVADTRWSIRTVRKSSIFSYAKIKTKESSLPVTLSATNKTFFVPLAIETFGALLLILKKIVKRLAVLFDSRSLFWERLSITYSKFRLSQSL